MRVVIDRTEFLRGDLRGRKRPHRPPWSLPETQFRMQCDSCGRCLQKCPTRIIELGRGKLPTINFNIGECLFCGDCVEACNSGSLSKTRLQQKALPWTHKVLITEKCLNNQGVLCRSCGDRCTERAIVFRPRTGGKVDLEIELESCNGCGACVAPCPVQAIVMTEPSNSIAPAKNTELKNCA
ncbi:MAG: ferredoxin-type protein NapF [Gammaproteobacteria bacterium]|nr:ferredoxin-type protein NapF [Gammaproteobacteria bacterium]